MFSSMHLYAEKDKRSEKIGAIAKGSKVWALNDDPAAEGWIKIAYVKKGNVGVGWSRFDRSKRFKPVGTETVKETQCNITSSCDDSDLHVPGDINEEFCGLLSGMPVPVENESQWRADAMEMMKKAQEFNTERHQKMTAALPEQLRAQVNRMDDHIDGLRKEGYCLTWPLWCPVKHMKLNWEWRALQSTTKKMVQMVAGHEAASADFQSNINKLLLVDEHKELAEKAWDLVRKLAEAFLKVLDGSGPGQHAAWSAVWASSTHLKAFCTAKLLKETMNHTWKSPAWWKSMFDRCTGEPLSPDEKASLEHEAEEAMDAIGHMQANSKLRTIVESSRGVSLVQTRDQHKAEQASSFIDHSTEQNELPNVLEFLVMFSMVAAIVSVGAVIVTMAVAA